MERILHYYFFDGENTSLIREFCKDSNGKILNKRNYKRINDSTSMSLIVVNEEIFGDNIGISKIETKIIEDE